MCANSVVCRDYYGRVHEGWVPSSFASYQDSPHYESAEEVRVVNESTGGEKGQKGARFDLLPWAQLRQVAELYGKGAQKYEARNWERGYDWSLSFAALHRHLEAFWSGEYNDEENGLPHLTSVVFHALALMYFHDNCPELDDRPKVRSGKDD